MLMHSLIKPERNYASKIGNNSMISFKSKFVVSSGFWMRGSIYVPYTSECILEISLISCEANIQHTGLLKNIENKIETM